MGSVSLPADNAPESMDNAAESTGSVSLPTDNALESKDDVSLPMGNVLESNDNVPLSMGSVLERTDKVLLPKDNVPESTDNVPLPMDNASASMGNVIDFGGSVLWSGDNERKAGVEGRGVWPHAPPFEAGSYFVVSGSRVEVRGAASFGCAFSTPPDDGGGVRALPRNGCIPNSTSFSLSVP